MKTSSVFAVLAAGAIIPMAAEAGTPITNTIDGVEWRFMLDTPTGTEGTAMLGINPDTSGSANRDKDHLHGCSIDVNVNAANIPWEFDYEGVHYTVTKVADGAFYTNTRLTGIITIPPAVTELRDHAFQGCSGLTGLRGGDSVTYWGVSSFNSCVNMQGAYPDLSAATSFGEFVFQSTPLTGTLKLGNSLTTIQRLAFKLCNFTGPAIIPSSVTAFGHNSNYGVFEGSQKLTAIWIKGPATVANQTYLTVYCACLAKGCSSLKMILMGQNTKGARKTQTGNNAMLNGVNGVQVFAPANGQWNDLYMGGNNNKLWRYGADQEFNLVVDDNLKTATFTPTTVNTLTNALVWAPMFKEHFDLDPRISVTNTLDLTGVTITEQMVSGVTFDRLMFAVKTQAELNAILDAFPASVPLAIDPSGITENLTIPAERKIFVQLSETDAVKLKVKGLVIVVK